MTDPSDDLTRRRVLRAGASTAGVLALGGAASARPTTTQAKRGGRAQLDGTVRRNAPFTLTPEGTDVRNASCMSGNSAMQTYLTYTIQYCDSEDDEADGTLYVLPDEAEPVPTEVYEVHAVQPCRASDLDMVAFGPSDEPCN